MGRHTVPKTPEFAPAVINEVEHFLFNCNLYDHVFDLTFTETLVIGTPFLTTMKKALFIFNNVDPHIYTFMYGI